MEEVREVICKLCGKIFYVNKKSHARPKYCSDECRKLHEKDAIALFNLLHKNSVTNKLNENSIEGIDYIECPICHEKHALITLTHFRRHGYTNINDVKKDFPNILLTCQNMKNQYKGENNPMSSKNKSELERKLSSPYSIEHYIKKYGKELALEKLQEFLDSLNRDNWNINTRIEYFINLGMSKEEATIALKNRQIQNGLLWYVNKYGDETGKELYDKRIKKWVNTLRQNFIENGDCRSFQSKFANTLIKEICEELHMDIPKYEKYISDNEGNNYAYDFTYGKKIIEFNGDYWHCNPAIYKSNYFNKNKQKTAEELWAYDANKIAIAEKHGYNVLTIWESDYNNDPIQTFKKCMKFINE